ncbi:hypothetical protein HYY75_00925 [bacterium]|nr:hypothetical protein [bacterium]
MFSFLKRFFGFSPKPFQLEPAINFTKSPRMMFALRERLEEEGLGESRQARLLDHSFLKNRDYIIESLAPLFHHMDKNRIPRSLDPRFWWWHLDDERVYESISERFNFPMKDSKKEIPILSGLFSV